MDEKTDKAFMSIIKKNFSEEELKKYEKVKISAEDIEFATEKAKEELKLYKKSFREFSDKIKHTSLVKELKWSLLHMAESLVTLQDLIEFKDRKKIMQYEHDVYIHIQKYRSKLFSEILKKHRKGDRNVNGKGNQE